MWASICVQHFHAIERIVASPDRSCLYLHHDKVDALAESSVAPVAIHVELDDSAERYGGLGLE